MDKSGTDTAKGRGCQDINASTFVVCECSPQVVNHQEQRIGGAESSRTNFIVLGRVKFAVGQDLVLRVLAGGGVEERLTHEREI